ncbi:MAG: hypothetical protein ACI8XB_001292 [Patiriisocius sp.]|jgi:hypothetical protein
MIKFFRGRNVKNVWETFLVNEPACRVGIKYELV